MLVPLKETEISSALAELPGWECRGGDSLFRLVKFDSYRSAVDFLNIIADLSESLDHHPSLNLGWREIGITLKTSSINALSNLDIELASQIENACKEFFRLKH